MIPPPKLRVPPLLQFRAGVLELKNGTVTADARKGYLSFLPRTSDSVELVWSDNSTKTSVVLPKGKTAVKFTEKCTTGRVLVFEVTAADASTATHFFWLQDKASDKDEEYLQRIRELVAPVQSSRTQSSPIVQLDDFKKMLASIAGQEGGEVDLVDIITSRKVTEALQNDPTFFSSRLSDTLPHIEGTTLCSEVQNTHVYAAARNLDAALRDVRTYKELCTQFGLETAGMECGVKCFIKALQKAQKKK